MKNRISLAFSTDDNYAQHLAVSIVSLIMNSSVDVYINVYILFNQLAEINRRKIRKLSQLRESVTIKFIQVGIEDLGNYPFHTGFFPMATYFRLKLPSLLSEMDRVIYLDSDIVVSGNIEEIWGFDLGSNLLAAVEEPQSLNGNRLNALGMRSNSPYFNAGVLLLNLKKMRETGFEEKCPHIVKTYYKHLIYQDQDILNMIAENDWAPLPLKYNCFHYVLDRTFDGQYYFYTPTDVINAVTNPVVIHYNLRPKPWFIECSDARKNYYFEYLKLTPYKNDIWRIRFDWLKWFMTHKQKILIPRLKAFIKKVPLIHKTLKFLKSVILS